LEFCFRFWVIKNEFSFLYGKAFKAFQNLLFSSPVPELNVESDVSMLTCDGNFDRFCPNCQWEG
jgi:hypothetical protein